VDRIASIGPRGGRKGDPNIGRIAVTARDTYLAVLAGIAGVTALAWFDLWRRAGEMTHDTGAGMNMAMALPQPTPWNVPDLLAAGTMWSIMMIAMMLPSATPMLVFISGVRRSRQATAWLAAPAALFVAGFLVIWLAWSWLAAGLQWTLQASLALSPQMAVARLPLAAVFLAVAGTYQFTPLKHACLSRCQSPLGFLFTQWRDGAWGAAQMGVRYGAYCIGCCWALMAVLFVVGVMNLLWVALLAIFVLLEKTVLRGPWPSRMTGAALIAWALYLLRVSAA
jgi:predicted metal-binding membrane protein